MSPPRAIHFALTALLATALGWYFNRGDAAEAPRASVAAPDVAAADVAAPDVAAPDVAAPDAAGGSSPGGVAPVCEVQFADTPAGAMVRVVADSDKREELRHVLSEASRSVCGRQLADTSLLP